VDEEGEAEGGREGEREGLFCYVLLTEAMEERAT